MGSLAEQLDDIELAEKKIQAKRFRTLEKAMRSDSPEDMIKAAQIIDSISPKVEQNTKSFFIDPLQFNANLGYKDKPYSLSYETLRRMSKTPVINSIIKTRKNQIADFAEPQENKYSSGFVIRKKHKNESEQEMDNKDKKIAHAITDFIMNGGSTNTWERDDFDTFIRKIVEDSLVYDQMTFEVIRNRRGGVESFIATDASTFRMSEAYYDKDYNNAFFQRRGADVISNRKDFGKKVYGYYPAYVQVYNSVKINEFYPWELCFGVRNPSTSVYSNGYGVSELEELINVVTSMLWGDEYNRRFFSQGSAPKGLLRVKGNTNEAALQQFKQQWQSMITGVMQSWKTPVVEADVDWIDLQKSNRDMEYTEWTEYLIKQACAVYSIDPTEIGWDISRSGGNSGLFEGSQEQRLKHSKGKGLYPLLKFIQRKINKYIVEQINPDFEFVFVGVNGITIADELKMDIDKVNSFMTLNEVRQKYELDPIEHGDCPNNGVYLQNKNIEKQSEMQSQNGGMYGGGFSYGGGGYSEEDEDWQEGTPNDEEDTDWSIDDPNDPWYVDEEEFADKSEGTEWGDNLIKAFDNFINRELEK